jgi:hypothetical protein
MCHQRLSKPHRYLETSASARFTFSMARGVNRGWLSPAYGLAELSRHAITHRVDAMGVGTTTATGAVCYYDRPTDTLTLQGYGPVLLAGHSSTRCLARSMARIQSQHIPLPDAEAL